MPKSIDTTLMALAFVGEQNETVTGKETIVMAIPDAIAPKAPDSPVDDTVVEYVIDGLHDLIDTGRMPQSVRGGNVWVTRDPKVLVERALDHVCPTCQAGCDQALAEMKEFPGKVFAIYQLETYGDVWRT